jgi:hypothetical protein
VEDIISPPQSGQRNQSSIAPITRSNLIVGILHTMWMPRSCSSNDMNAASTPYGLVRVVPDWLIPVFMSAHGNRDDKG